MSTPTRSISRGKRLMSTRRRMHDNEKAGIANLVAALVVGDGSDEDLDMDVEAGAVSDVGGGDEFAQEMALNSQAEAALTARPAHAYAAEAAPPEPRRMATVSMADIADLEAAFDDGSLPSNSPSSDAPSTPSTSTPSASSIRKPRKLPLAPSIVTSIPRLSRSSRTSRKRTRARPLPNPSLRSRIMGTLRMPTTVRGRVAAGLMAALLVVAAIVAAAVYSGSGSGSGSGATVKVGTAANVVAAAHSNAFAESLSAGGTDDAQNPTGPYAPTRRSFNVGQLDQLDQAQEQGEARPVKGVN